MMAWALIPGQEIVAHGLAVLRVVGSAEGVPIFDGVEDVIKSIVVGGDDGREGEPEISALDTATGPAARVIQQVQSADPGAPLDTLDDWLAYCWKLDARSGRS